MMTRYSYFRYIIFLTMCLQHCFSKLTTFFTMTTAPPGAGLRRRPPPEAGEGPGEAAGPRRPASLAVRVTKQHRPSARTALAVGSDPTCRRIGLMIFAPPSLPGHPL